MNINTTVTLSFDPGENIFPKRICSKQLDHLTREISVSLIQNGSAFVAPNGAEVFLRGTKPDCTVFHIPGERRTDASEGEYTFVLTGTALSVAGVIRCDVAYSYSVGDTTRIGSTGVFFIDNIPSATDPEAPESEGEFISVEKAVAKANAAANRADNVATELIEAFESISTVLPKVFFSGNINPMTKDYPVDLTMSYRSAEESFDGYVEIKWQGTSSLAYPKKNFTIKMYSDEAHSTKLKKNFCGWGEQNKFCLKANYVDATHARNIISARLWGDVVASRADYETLPIELKTSPNNGAIDGFPFKLYMNGVYQGIYTWNIPKDAWMWNMDEDNPKHVLLCAETNADGEHTCNFSALWTGVDGDGWSVEVGTHDPSVTSSLNKLIMSVAYETDDIFKTTINEELDIQSAIDYYIHQLVIYGRDNMAKNMLLATYDLTKWYIGAYDMDSTYGMEWDGSKIYPADTPIEGGFCANNSLLWARMCTLFADEISTRYSELRKSVYTVPNMVTMFERFMDSIGKDLYAEDLEMFPDIPSAEITNINQIRSFIAERLAFIDKQLLPPMPIYQLRNTTVFDGTNYINTGIDLDDVEEYTVMVDYAVNELSESRAMLIDRYNADNGVGWGVQYSSGVAYGGMWANDWIDFAAHDWGCTDPSGIQNKIVIRKNPDGAITLFTHRGTNNVNATASIQEGETGMYVTLGAKCWVSENGKSYDSFIKATMYDCKIYDVALSDDECNAYVSLT